MKIIGLSGTNGAGKDLVGEILAKEHGYMFVSVSDLLREECRQRGLPIERQNLSAISSEWRRSGGLGVLVDKAVQVFTELGKTSEGLVIASLRNDGEADRVHELGGTMLWVDADPQVRYDRIFSRQRTSEDNKSFEQFLAEEKAEMYGDSSDPTALNMSAVKGKCDLTILNEGSDVQKLASDVSATLGSLI